MSGPYAAAPAAGRARGFLRDLRRAASWHRRLLAAGLAAAAVAIALTVLRPAPPPTVRVLVAAHDLGAGTAVGPSDVRTTAFPAAAVPDGVLADAAAVLGRQLAAPVRRGEPLTDVRLVGAAALHGYGAGLVGTPVRIADAGVAGLLRPGTLVDVLSVPSDTLGDPARAQVLAHDVRVVSVGGDRGGAAGADGLLVVLATTTHQATVLARGQAGARLSVTLH